jgi:hypothetical protein
VGGCFCYLATAPVYIWDHLRGSIEAAAPDAVSHSGQDDGISVDPSEEHDDSLVSIPLMMEALTSYVMLRALYEANHRFE